VCVASAFNSSFTGAALCLLTVVVFPQDGQLAGVVGGSGGTDTIATVTQVFLNHFIVGMDPLAAVQHPRIYHKVISKRGINAAMRLIMRS
jgi:gamma-glutamyltranspeptidase